MDIVAIELENVENEQFQIFVSKIIILIFKNKITLEFPSFIKFSCFYRLFVSLLEPRLDLLILNKEFFRIIYFSVRNIFMSSPLCSISIKIYTLRAVA